MTDEVSWEGQCCDAAYNFARRCAELRQSNPYGDHYWKHRYAGEQTDLDFLIETLMTELWDHNFSKTEIHRAFEGALEALPEYAAGIDRRDQGPH